jgi:four helix bundle protein
VEELTKLKELPSLTPQLLNSKTSSGGYMGKIERFEDIQAWQKARELNKGIYRTTGTHPFSKDFSLRDQVRRASVSIMANIAEGFGRRSKKEFSNFLNMAHGSAAELQCHLYVALDLQYITKGDFETLYGDAEEVSRMRQGFMKYLHNYKES